MRSPKNRFLGLFCHANDVDQSWGLNWPFSCGVIIFSIVCGLTTFSDLLGMAKRGYLTSSFGVFKFMFVVRLFSDLIALIAIGFSIHSLIGLNQRSGVIGYYTLILSLLLNTVFLVYCLIHIFTSEFWKLVGFYFVPWCAEEFVLFLFTWILFCNMVDIGRKLKAQQNTFV